MTLKQKWDLYIALMVGGDTDTIEQSNNLIIEIEKELQFKNEKEHEEWLSLGQVWKGEEKWLKMTRRIIKRSENVLYHVGIKADSSFTLYGEVMYTVRDYWTSVKTSDGATETYVKLQAKDNLKKQLAMDLFGTPKLYKRAIYIDNSDLKVVRV